MVNNRGSGLTTPGLQTLRSRTRILRSVRDSESDDVIRSVHMETQNSLGNVALEALRGRIVRILPTQIRACVNELSEEQLWWRPNEQANSVGNLVLHLSGSMRHYLSHGVGGINYHRDRPAEFAERGPLPKDQLLAILDETIDQAAQVFVSFDTSRFLEPTEE